MFWEFLKLYCYKTLACVAAPALLPLENKHNRGPGVILTFGQGDVGQLGLGPDIMEKSRPALIPDVNDIIDICAGGMHTICLTSKGKVITFIYYIL